MKKTIKRFISVCMILIMIFTAMPLSVLQVEAASYPSVSLNVPYYRQQGVGLCSFAAFSMAEAYAAGYGSNNENVYQAIRKSHAPDGKGGYIADPFISPALLDGKKYKTVSTNFETIYNYLKKNTPVVIYRGGDQPHWAIIYGYNGSSTSLEKSGFLVLNDARTDNLNFVWKQTLTEFLAGSTTTSLKYCAVRVNGVLPTVNGPTDGNLMYSSNTNSNYTSVYTTDISDNDATIYTYLKGATKIKGCGFYIGTDENNLKKITKSLSGTSDGAGTVEYIFYKMSKWYGTLEPGTKYFYKFWYLDANGKEETSPVNWFITTGTTTKTVSSISIKTMPEKTEYYTGQELDTSGLAVTVSYSDGSVKDITSGFVCSSDSFLESGTKTVTVTYEGKTVEFDIEVLSDDSLILYYDIPEVICDKSTYYVADTAEFSWQDCFLNVPEEFSEDMYYTATVYFDGEEIYSEVLKEPMFTYLFENEGDYTFTVTSNLRSSSQAASDIYLVVDEADSASLSALAADFVREELSYEIGESFSTQDIVLWAIYSDSSQEIIEEYDFSVFDSENNECSRFDKPGEYSVVIYYEDIVFSLTAKVYNEFVLSFETDCENECTITWSEFFPGASYIPDVYFNGEFYDGGIATQNLYFTFAIKEHGEYLIKVRASDGTCEAYAEQVFISEENINCNKQIQVEDVTASSGETVAVPIKIVQNPGLAGLRIFVEYPEELELVSIADNNLFSSPISTSDKYASPFVISWFSLSGEDEFSEGDYVTLNFKVKDDTPEGVYAITAVQKSGDAVSSAGDSYMIDIKSGSVTVVNRVSGDVTDDGNVNMMDIVLLQQYLNNWDVSINESNADVTGDGKINMMDIVLLQQYLNNWDVTLK